MKFRPSRAMSEGLVVQPARMPQLCTSRIWSILAVSIKIFMDASSPTRRMGGNVQIQRSTLGCNHSDRHRSSHRRDQEFRPFSLGPGICRIRPSFKQWDQHKWPVGDAWMWQRESGIIEDPVTRQEDVQIEGTIAPVFAASTPCGGLQLNAVAHEGVRRASTLEEGDTIEKEAPSTPATHGWRSIPPRRAQEGEIRLGGELPECSLEVASAVTETAPESEGDLHFWRMARAARRCTSEPSDRSAA